MLADRFGLSSDDVVYLSMPMFHSNAIIAGVDGRGAGTVRRSRCAASSPRRGFLADVRRYGVTYANYVGKPLSYVLATPEHSDDADNTLQIVYGNEAFRADIVASSRDASGSAWSTASAPPRAASPSPRTADTPPGALGPLVAGQRGGPPSGHRRRLPAAEFDAVRHASSTPTEAIGEMVNTSGAGRVHRLLQRIPTPTPSACATACTGAATSATSTPTATCTSPDALGDWVRVDGENLGAAPDRTDPAALSRIRAGRGVRGTGREVGDRVMAAVIPTADAADFDPVAFAEFLDAQPDLGPKQWPTLLRVCSELPRTATFKVVTRTLSAERWHCPEPVWIRERGQDEFALLTPELALTLERQTADA